MRDFWRASVVCLLIALAVSVVVACSHRYSLIATGSTIEHGTVYRIDHWTGRVACVLPDVDAQGNPVGVKICDRMRSTTQSAPENFAMADLRDVSLCRSVRLAILIG